MDYTLNRMGHLPSFFPVTHKVGDRELAGDGGVGLCVDSDRVGSSDQYKTK